MFFYFGTHFIFSLTGGAEWDWIELWRVSSHQGLLSSDQYSGRECTSSESWSRNACTRLSALSWLPAWFCVSGFPHTCLPAASRKGSLGPVRLKHVLSQSRLNLWLCIFIDCFILLFVVGGSWGSARGVSQTSERIWASARRLPAGNGGTSGRASVGP